MNFQEYLEMLDEINEDIRNGVLDITPITDEEYDIIEGYHATENPYSGLIDLAFYDKEGNTVCVKVFAERIDAQAFLEHQFDSDDVFDVVFEA